MGQSSFGFFLVVTIGFAAVTVYALGLALDYRGWRSTETDRYLQTAERFLPTDTRLDAFRRPLDIFGRIVAWIVVAAGTVAFAYGIVAIVSLP